MLEPIHGSAPEIAGNGHRRARVRTIRGRLAWQIRPPALELTTCTPPAVIPRLSNYHLGYRVIPRSVANQRRRARFACGRICRLRVRTLGPTDRRPRPAGALTRLVIPEFRFIVR